MVPSGIEESLSASFFSDMIGKEREGMGNLVWKLQRQITKWASLILHSQVTDAFPQTEHELHKGSVPGPARILL